MNRVMDALKELYDTAVAVSGWPLADINSVYYWDPMQIPESSLPALAIQPIGTEYNDRGSKYDEKICIVEIRLIYNQKSFYKTDPTIAKKVYAIEKAIEQVEKTDTDWTTMSNSVCGVIQQNKTLPYTDWWTTKRFTRNPWFNYNDSGSTSTRSDRVR